jgi:hypothetical protein
MVILQGRGEAKPCSSTQKIKQALLCVTPIICCPKTVLYGDRNVAYDGAVQHCEELRNVFRLFRLIYTCRPRCTVDRLGCYLCFM